MSTLTVKIRVRGPCGHAVSHRPAVWNGTCFSIGNVRLVRHQTPTCVIGAVPPEAGWASGVETSDIFEFEKENFYHPKFENNSERSTEHIHVFGAYNRLPRSSVLLVDRPSQTNQPCRFSCLRFGYFREPRPFIYAHTPRNVPIKYLHLTAPVCIRNKIINVVN